MYHSIAKILSPISIGLLMVTLVFTSFGVAADDSAVDIEVNGLFYGDGDFQEYNFYSVSEPDGRGFVYVKKAGPNQIYVLVRVSFIANDNAFSPNKPNQDSYLASVDWKNPHDLGRLIGSDHMAMFMECESGAPASSWAWTQDLLYDADPGPEYDWRSDSSGPDGVPVASPTGDAIPSSGIVITSHSSLEYNLENSSWIADQMNLFPNDLGQWMSPDIAPLGTISTTEPMTDVNAITGVHEDYPFYVSTGNEEWDLFEWELSYEMLLDVSHCNGQPVYLGVSSAHNSPPKDGTEDVNIPTAITLSHYSASSGSAPVMPVLIVVAAGLFISVLTRVHLRRTTRATKK